MGKRTYEILVSSYVVGVKASVIVISLEDSTENMQSIRMWNVTQGYIH